MSNELKVVHAAETIRGGIASYLREIIPRQVARYGAGQVAVVAPTDHVGDLDQPEGAVLMGVPRASSRLTTAWRVRRRLVAALAEQPADIVHVHSSFAGMVCRAHFLKPKNCKRLVYCPHGWGFVRQGRSAAGVGWVEKHLQNKTDAIVCVSEAEKATALEQGLTADKLHVIHNGLPDRRIPEPSEPADAAAPLRLLFIGRLDRAKGIDVLLAALARLERSVVVDVFGESVLGEYAADKLPDCVRMHGWQSYAAIEPVLAVCDAVVMPSRWEGLPVSGIEAMRAGKPLIASKVGGLVELVEDGVTGRLVPPDDPAMLGQVLETVQRVVLGQMGQRARMRFLEYFQIDQCESRLAEVYQCTLSH